MDAIPTAWCIQKRQAFIRGIQDGLIVCVYIFRPLPTNYRLEVRSSNKNRLMKSR